MRRLLCLRCPVCGEATVRGDAPEKGKGSMFGALHFNNLRVLTEHVKWQSV